ncbi:MULTISPECIES: hydroxymethylbilane synthase [unclassified Gilliamella]|uniref:hydroxymethylbilane synthase n=1 Tax=unclassified Gilliamella TaxID=2685620 RepID=UPI00226A3C1E|nr:MULTISPECIES: hydroxymethylbilane synthase [unclassified Gilliamella]MCX8642373.1 hydroxymethylbilane synthase [Gilliamella sp. B3835]MCX8707771.1 hydroxymethylbilane synthase [Gilliamella sp. B3783]MCX8709344.1 hydroxymethylbilane synthase [Gilliamella sp. B3780]MCX8715230.1 hydroxymethylbilane synthase [Gilliamella sp. B3781]MCX8716754.1 hydroxymethylbilane synthase [Gilliamella sp. B3784]
MKIRIATRRSPLALWQANFVKQNLLLAHKNLTVELIPMMTQGDIILDSPLAKIGGKGLFVKQLEQAILTNQADIAVHSIKDIPAQFPEGLTLATICQRDDVRDAFISNHYSNLDELPNGAIVGTSSLRRQCQLRANYPHLQIKDLRGNVGTRLAKLDNQEYDAIILASVGLKRLDLQDRIKQYIGISSILPAVGQGAIGIETRANDKPLLDILSVLDDKNSRICIQAERAMNKALQGGCQVPIACYSQLNNDILSLQGLVGSIDGSKIIKATVEGSINDPEKLGQTLAEHLLEQGAKSILQELNDG